MFYKYNDFEQAFVLDTAHLGASKLYTWQSIAHTYI